MCDRVRGVALSKEKFQFIFKYEQDLEEIISRAVWSYNDRTIVIDRWVENPPSDYLQFLHVWVQIRNIPVNHYTLASITSLREIIGQVLEVAFDPAKPQGKEYVRVRVRFDVSKPLRRSKVVNFPSGDPVTIWYDFERFQKRCYFCQRLSHEREKCPLFLNKHLGSLNTGCQVENPKPPALLKASAPLFGVLSEDLKNDPLGQESLLPLPIITKQVDKGKPRGLVQLGTGKTGNDQKLLASAIQAGSGVRNFPRDSSYSLFEGDGAKEMVF